jgi:hypothetical protein
MLGLSNKRIAVTKGLALGTVKAHVKSILDKLDATSRTEAVAIAQRRGLLREQADRSDPDAVARRSSPGQFSGYVALAGQAAWARARFKAAVHHSRSSISALAGTSSSANPASTSPPW